MPSVQSTTTAPGPVSAGREQLDAALEQDGDVRRLVALPAGSGPEARRSAQERERRLRGGGEPDGDADGEAEQQQALAQLGAETGARAAGGVGRVRAGRDGCPGSTWCRWSWGGCSSTWSA